MFVRDGLANDEMGLQVWRGQDRGPGRDARICSAARARASPRCAISGCRCRPDSRSRPKPAHIISTTTIPIRRSCEDEAAAALAAVEKSLGARFGDADNPLLVSVRSGARVSMPGMLDTVLNLGLNDRAVEGLAHRSGDERFAYDSYRRFIQMYGQVVLGVDHHHFEELLDDYKFEQRLQVRHRSCGRGLEDHCRRLQGCGRRGARDTRFRRIRASSFGARSAPSSAPG